MTEEVEEPKRLKFKFEDRFEILIKEFDEKMQKTKKPKKLIFEYEDKIIRLFKQLIARACYDDIRLIFNAFNVAINLINEEKGFE